MAAGRRRPPGPARRARHGDVMVFEIDGASPQVLAELAEYYAAWRRGPRMVFVNPEDVRVRIGRARR